MKPTASFLGWQEFSQPFPLFDIKGGERNGSTVSDTTLRKLGIDIPSYPSYEAYKKGEYYHG